MLSCLKSLFVSHLLYLTLSSFPPFPFAPVSFFLFFFFCHHHLWSTAELTCLQGKHPPSFSRSFCLSLLYSFITPSLSCALPWHWRDQFTQQQLRQASFVPGLPSEKAFFAPGELLTAHSDIERLIALLPNLAVLLFSGSLSC